MIARIWKGKTKIDLADQYTQFMKDRALPDYEATTGFIKLSFLRREDKGIAYFDLITYWENMEAIKNFAGDDVEKAKYYPEDQDYLLDFPEKVIHYEVFVELGC